MPIYVCVILIITVLLICYFSQKRKKETFKTWLQYRPACGGKWMSERIGQCKGLTTGEMPSIEDITSISWAPCPGSGVPPPIHH